MIDEVRAGAVWRKSSHSGSGNADCVEVATNLPGIVGVRDSKDPEGLHLGFSHADWRALTARIKRGELSSRPNDS
ncbi:DUF397 domain-containing protein [Actinomadura adrarensis]|uniref:DUF397 domain-containing protein n=1 Tax=Actinomadura adrarensis TaxID=1819600 RepID=A0ABW3CUB3_9ACTN